MCKICNMCKILTRLTRLTELTWLTGLTGLTLVTKVENGITDSVTRVTCRDASASKNIKSPQTVRFTIVAQPDCKQ